MTEETKFTMEYGAGRPTARHQRKQALLWRMHLARLDRQSYMSKLRRSGKERFNTDNKPLGVK